MVVIIEEALEAIKDRLSNLVTGDSFTYTRYKYDDAGNPVIEAGAHSKEEVEINGYLDIVTTYHDKLEPVIGVAGDSQSGIGVSYKGGVTFKMRENGGIIPAYGDEDARYGYKHRAVFKIAAFVGGSATQQDKMSNSSTFSVFDVMDDIRILISGFVPAPWCSGLEWTKTDSVELFADQDEATGPVCFVMEFVSNVFQRCERTLPATKATPDTVFHPEPRKFNHYGEVGIQGAFHDGDKL